MPSSVWIQPSIEPNRTGHAEFRQPVRRGFAAGLGEISLEYQLLQLLADRLDRSKPEIALHRAGGRRGPIPYESLYLLPGFSKRCVRHMNFSISKQWDESVRRKVILRIYSKLMYVISGFCDTIATSPFDGHAEVLACS